LLAEVGLEESISKLIPTPNTMHFDFNLNLSVCSRLSKELAASGFSDKTRNVISAFGKIEACGPNNDKMKIQFLVHDVDDRGLDLMIESCVKNYVTSFVQVSCFFPALRKSRQIA
jgi:hypothetical protein